MGIVLAKCEKVTVAIFVIVAMAGTSVNMVTYQLAPMDLAPNYAGQVIESCSCDPVCGWRRGLWPLTLFCLCLFSYLLTSPFIYSFFFLVALQL